MEIEQKTQEYTYLMRMTSAQNEMLERLEKKTGRSKAALIREAINLLLGTYKNVIDSEIVDGQQQSFKQ